MLADLSFFVKLRKEEKSGAEPSEVRCADAEGELLAGGVSSNMPIMVVVSIGVDAAVVGTYDEPESSTCNCKKAIALRISDGESALVSIVIII